MVTHIWRRRRAETTPEDTRPADSAAAARPATSNGSAGSAAGLRRIVTRQRPVEAVPQTVLVDRRTARRWRGARRNNLVSAAIWLAAWVAAGILVLGILLTWANANPANDILHPILRAADWLGSPFRDAFLGHDPKHRLYADWGVAAGGYLVIGRVLSWLTRW
jgi:hypothetical protein